MKEIFDKLDFNKLKEKIKTYCTTSLGKEKIDLINSMLNFDRINYELDITCEMVNILNYDEVFPIDGIKDIRDSLARVSIINSFLQPKDFLSILSVLKTSRKINNFFLTRKDKYPLLYNLSKDIFYDKLIERNIESIIDENETIKDSASRTLNNIRQRIKYLNTELSNQLEKILKKYSEKNYVQEELITQRDGRSVIPIKVEHKRHIPGFIHSASASGLTVFIEPAETLELNNEIRSLEFEEKREVERILRELTDYIRDNVTELKRTIDILSFIDFTYAKAKYAIDYGAVKPVFNKSGCINIRQGYHPILLLIHKKEEVVPGCELTYKAYKLGMIKSLGDCETNVEIRSMQVCELRQKDEPFVHYSIRMFEDIVQNKFGKTLRETSWQKLRDGFLKQMDYSAALFGKVVHVLQGAPKAAHYIFTSIKKPEGAQLESVYRDMLFENQYGEPVGQSSEYTIFWDMPRDACQLLSQNPEKFLDKYGILRETRLVYKRLKENWSLKGLQSFLTAIYSGSAPPLPPPPSTSFELLTRAIPLAQTVISFQCANVAQPNTTLADVKVWKFRLFDNNYEAREVDIPAGAVEARTRLSYYRKFGQAMADNFKYAGPLTRPTPPTSGEGNTYLLTKLEFLKEADVFSGQDWILDQNNIFEIYPFYYHVERYIQSFRQTYRKQRTRL